ncbi:MAG: BON domain-containing protein [Candidatus Sericytochromatia bacterium]
MRATLGMIGLLGLGAGAAVWWDGDRRRHRDQTTPDTGPDAALEARVRERVSRYASRPEAIAVRVASGMVTLTGTILDREVDDLVAVIGRLPGVRRVEDRLDLRPEGRVENTPTRPWQDRRLAPVALGAAAAGALVAARRVTRTR